MSKCVVDVLLAKTCWLGHIFSVYSKNHQCLPNVIVYIINNAHIHTMYGCVYTAVLTNTQILLYGTEQNTMTGNNTVQCMLMYNKQCIHT